MNIHNQQVKQLVLQLRTLQKIAKYLRSSVQSDKPRLPLFGPYGLFSKFSSSDDLSLELLIKKYENNAKLKKAAKFAEFFLETTKLQRNFSHPSTLLWPMDIYGNLQRELVCEALIEEKQKEILELLPLCTRNVRFLIHVLYGFG